MAVKCAHCRGTDIVYGFDMYQCLECGGHSKMDGTPTVPTCALESDPDATYDGVGAHLIDDPERPPFRAKAKIY